MIDQIKYKYAIYPAFQATGNAARFAIPFAMEVCHGDGYDIGCNRAEWAFPGARMIDPAIDKAYDAHHLPVDETGKLVQVDYIFSSHCLEHVYDWVRALDVWSAALKNGGTLFLYLPHYNQTYWRPWNNTKHVNILTAEMICDYLADKGYRHIYSTGMDLNHSFMVMAERWIQH